LRASGEAELDAGLDFLRRELGTLAPEAQIFERTRSSVHLL
jgi:hypothetical protein